MNEQIRVCEYELGLTSVIHPLLDFSLTSPEGLSWSSWQCTLSVSGPSSKTSPPKLQGPLHQICHWKPWNHFLILKSISRWFLYWNQRHRYLYWNQFHRYLPILFFQSYIFECLYLYFQGKNSINISRI